jgi:hypothetical protein
MVAPGATAPARTSPRLIGVGAVAGAVALWLAFSAWIGPHGLDLRSDGYLLTLAARVLDGQVPYRDFSYIRPPLPIFLQAALLATVPDYGILASRWYFAGQVALILLAAAALLARVEPRPGARAGLALGGTLLALTGGLSPMPWHTVDGTCFSLLATWALVLALERGRPGLAALGGLAAGAAALSKQGFVVVALAGLALTCTPAARQIGRRPWHAPAAYLAGLAAVLAAATGYLAVHGALGAAVEAILRVPAETSRDVFGRRAAGLLVGMHVPRAGGVLLGAGLLALIAAPLPAGLQLGLAAALPAAGLGAIWTQRAGGGIYLAHVAYVVEPLHAAVWLGGLGLLIRHALRRGAPGEPGPGTAWILALGLATLYAATWSYVGIRAGVAALALAAPLTLLAVARAADRGRASRPGAAWAVAAGVVLGGALCAVTTHVDMRYGAPGQGRVAYRTPRAAGILSRPIRVQTVDGVVELIRREVPPDGRIFAFIEFPALYVLSERRNATRVDWFLSEEVSRAEVARALADLRARPPALVVLWAENPARFRDPRLSPILAFIRERYAEAETVGEVLVFRPRVPAP